MLSELTDADAHMQKRMKRPRPSDSRPETSPQSDDEPGAQHDPPPRYKPRLDTDSPSVDRAAVNQDEAGASAGAATIDSGTVSMTIPTAMGKPDDKPGAAADSASMEMDVELAPADAEHLSLTTCKTAVDIQSDRRSHSDTVTSDHGVSAGHNLPIGVVSATAGEDDAGQRETNRKTEHLSTRMDVEPPNAEDPQIPNSINLMGESNQDDDGGNTECDSTESDNEHYNISHDHSFELGQLHTPVGFGPRPVAACARRAVWISYDVLKVRLYSRLCLWCSFGVGEEIMFVCTLNSFSGKREFCSMAALD